MPSVQTRAALLLPSRSAAIATRLGFSQTNTGRPATPQGGGARSRRRKDR